MQIEMQFSRPQATYAATQQPYMLPEETPLSQQEIPASTGPNTLAPSQCMAGLMVLYAIRCDTHYERYVRYADTGTPVSFYLFLNISVSELLYCD